MVHDERRTNNTYGRRATDSDYMNGYEQGKKDAITAQDAFLYSIAGFLIGIIIPTAIPIMWPEIISDPFGKEKIGFLPLFLSAATVAIGMTTFNPMYKRIGIYAFVVGWAGIAAGPSILIIMYLAEVNSSSYVLVFVIFSVTAFVSLSIQGINNLDQKRAALRKFVTDEE